MRCLSESGELAVAEGSRNRVCRGRAPSVSPAPAGREPRMGPEQSLCKPRSLTSGLMNRPRPPPTTVRRGYSQTWLLVGSSQGTASICSHVPAYFIILRPTVVFFLPVPGALEIRAHDPVVGTIPAPGLKVKSPREGCLCCGQSCRAPPAPNPLLLCLGMGGCLGRGNSGCKSCTSRL